MRHQPVMGLWSVPKSSHVSFIQYPSQSSQSLSPMITSPVISPSFSSSIGDTATATRSVAYSKEGNGDNDAPVLRAGELVDGVADVAGVRLDGAATANACRCLSFGRHVV
jgi:hypothetical protein